MALKRPFIFVAYLLSWSCPISTHSTIDHSHVHHDLLHVSIPTDLDVHLHCDNQGAVKLAKNPIYHAKTKHIKRKYHFIRERVLEGEISVNSSTFPHKITRLTCSLSNSIGSNLNSTGPSLVLSQDQLSSSS